VTNVVKMENTAVAAMSEAEMMTVLQNSLYPGAQTESIKLVLGYCKAAGLDPMQKPVHIVPMDVAVKNEDGSLSYIKRDVIMPGIGLYRTQAARTNQYAGVSEPEFGPVKKIAVQRKQWNNGHKGDKSYTMVPDGEMEFPEWCRVTVEKIVDGQVRKFTAKEFWLENYATAGKDSTAPNAMWKKRPYAQLAKCAEAQALRKAFPEQTGAQPTADEMEGKTIDDEFTGATIDGRTGAVEQPKGVPPYPQDQFDANLPKWTELIAAGKKTADQIIAMVQTKGVLSEKQKETIQNAVKPAVDDEFVREMEGAAQ
jgi:phage recombination protein Bet